MTRLAFSNNRRAIHITDLSDVVAYQETAADHRVAKFAIAKDGTIYFVNANGYKHIYKTAVGADSGTETLYYQHPAYIYNVEVRSLSGENRVYFTTTGPGGMDAIYYLSPQNTPEQYYVINPDDIALYNWCTGQEDFYFYAGDFAFGENDTLYLSNGNSSPCGIYRITDAGPDTVNGSVERIYQDDQDIRRLAYDSGYLYFYKLGAQIWRLNLNTLQAEVAFDIPYPYNMSSVSDIAKVTESVTMMLPKPRFFWVRVFRWLEPLLPHPFRNIR